MDQGTFDAFVRKYGDHYKETLKLYQPNPPGRQEKRDDVQVWIQDSLVGGQYATAWSEQHGQQTRTHMVSIAHTYPEVKAADMAAEEVGRCLRQDRKAWMQKHRQWWHHYYPQSFISIPDADLEALYWQTIYRFACTSRSGRSMVDTAGLWFQGMSWPYYTTDWNIQSAHWPVYTANRLDQGQALVDRLHKKRQALVDAVLPKEWRSDSAYLAVAWDMEGSVNDDQRYDDLFGNLPWTMHNAWLQYRYSMDDGMLREKVFPLLRRSINLYLHLVRESPDGHLRLPATYSPETGIWEDCNFDLALFRWGCHTLLKTCDRLKIDDPLIAMEGNHCPFAGLPRRRAWLHVGQQQDLIAESSALFQSPHDLPALSREHRARGP